MSIANAIWGVLVLAYQERFKLYGDERIDMPGWLQWRELLLAEKRRREGVQ